MKVKEFNKITRERARIELRLLDLLKKVLSEKELEKLFKGSSDSSLCRAWKALTKRLNLEYKNVSYPNRP